MALARLVSFSVQGLPGIFPHSGPQHGNQFKATNHATVLDANQRRVSKRRRKTLAFKKPELGLTLDALESVLVSWRRNHRTAPRD
jgi:hypothetical protein